MMTRDPASSSAGINEFPVRERYTVSGLCIGDFCFTCERRIVEIGGEADMTLAWCDCGFPENHHEMEIL